jgi:hypothetical protein
MISLHLVRSQRYGLAAPDAAPLQVDVRRRRLVRPSWQCGAGCVCGTGFVAPCSAATGDCLAR